jgi:KaiC/GvpD/RAD55 family RecA-like ATPase
VAGLDDMLEGGIPEGFSVVVTGPPGTGKTTLCMQFLMEGIKNGEKCILFSFEERLEQLVQHFMRFSWDIGRYIDDGYLEVFGMSMLTFEEISEIIETCKSRRIVFDSLNMFGAPDEFRTSSSWRSSHRIMKKQKITSLLITEKHHGIETRVFDEFDFMGDEIIFLDSMPVNDVENTFSPVMAVQKMRATKIDSTPQSFRFGEHGIVKYRSLQLPSRLQEKLG